MRLFADKDIKRLFLATGVVFGIFLFIAEGLLLLCCRIFSVWLLVLILLAACGVWAVCLGYVNKQNRVMENAVSQINAYLDGNVDARIACDMEGQMYKLFHSVNTLAAILNAHAAKELQEKEFLKNTISDISHQLKTPLAALNIYNGLLQDEAEDLPAIKEFARLSEQELDRIETLVENLLKITRLDAGAIVIEKNMENVAEILRDVELHFAFRARQEQKELILSGVDSVPFCCDRDWIMEAVNNIVKNALDHTNAGDKIWICWKALPSVVEITIKDNGSGIHPEDLHHIFKRFYRSRYSKDTKGIGLGLPLAKAIIEAHNGVVTVDSQFGQGTTFTINFLIPTKL